MADMGSSRLCQCFSLAVIALISLQFGYAADVKITSTGSVQADELLQLQAASPDSVISFDTAAFNKYGAQRSRPYSLVVCFVARHLMDKPQLRLRDLRTEFGYLAKAYAGEPASRGKIFFLEIEVGRAPEVVRRLDLTSLPYIVRLGPALNLEDGNGKVKIPADEVMQASEYQNYPWSAEDMGRFISERTSLKPGAIDRPTFLKSPLFPVVLLATLAVGAWLAFKLYYADFMKNSVIWIVAVIAVYWFSVSGGMYNIIRGVPMQHWDKRSSKMVMFMPGQGQLGAEGFIMGSLYCTVGLCVALLTQLAPKVLVNDRKSQRYAAFGLLLVAVFAYLKITEIYHWKTGHRAVWYL